MARRCCSPAAGDLGQAQLADQPARPALAVTAGAGQSGRHQHVLLAAQLLDQLEGLEYEADVAQARPRERTRALRRDVLAREGDPAAVGAIEPPEQVQERRLAAARTAEHGDDLALLHLEVDPVEDAPLGPPGPERLRDAACLKDGHSGNGSEPPVGVGRLAW